MNELLPTFPSLNPLLSFFLTLLAWVRKGQHFHLIIQTRCQCMTALIIRLDFTCSVTYCSEESHLVWEIVKVSIKPTTVKQGHVITTSGKSINKICPSLMGLFLSNSWRTSSWGKKVILSFSKDRFKTSRNKPQKEDLIQNKGEQSKINLPTLASNVLK